MQSTCYQSCQYRLKIILELRLVIEENLLGIWKVYRKESCEPLKEM